MLHLINGKILLSGATILAAAALAIGGTFAFFSDSETSTGNTFSSGKLNLKIDSEAHYAGLVCNGRDWVDDNTLGTTRPDLVGQPCEGTWTLKDLRNDRFFALSDIKPGDTGENTISMHVFDNDAWEWFAIFPTDNVNGLQQALQFHVWLDQGSIPGFQCPDDSAPCPTDLDEGDNEFENEPVLSTPEPIGASGKSFELGPFLAAVRSGLAPVCTEVDPDGDGVTPGDTGACQGLPRDGHLVGSTTYYFGMGWELPSSTGNEVQGGSFVANMEFQAVQYRNNPSPVFPLPTPTP